MDSLAGSSAIMPVPQGYILNSNREPYSNRKNLIKFAYIGGSYSGTSAWNSVHALVHSTTGFKGTALCHLGNTQSIDFDSFMKEVNLAARQLSDLEEEPDILYGSSYGGAIVYQLVAMGYWNKPFILDCPALLLARQPWYGDFAYPMLNQKDDKTLVSLSIPIPFVVYHGLRDSLVPYAHSVEYIEKQRPNGPGVLVLTPHGHCGGLTPDDLFRRMKILHADYTYRSRYLLEEFERKVKEKQEVGLANETD